MFGGSGALSVSAGITLVFIFGAILPNWRWVCIGKCFTYVTKTIANLTTYSRKLRNSVMRVGSDTFGDPIFEKGLQN